MQGNRKIETTHQKKKQATWTIWESNLTLDLTEKNSNLAIISMFRELKESMIKELKEDNNVTSYREYQ